MTVSVAVLDPGGWSDSFCDVMAKITREKILLTDAIFWNKEIFPKLTTRKIKDDIAKLHNHFHFNKHLCETNNQGNMIISDLRNIPYRIPVIGVTTSGHLRKASTIARGTTLDKDKTVPWLMKFIEDGTIELPKTMTPGLKKGIDEISNYGVSKHGKYQALSGHDDFVSCLVILVHYAKRNILRTRASKLPMGLGAEHPYQMLQEEKDPFLTNIENRMKSAGMKVDDIEAQKDW